MVLVRDSTQAVYTLSDPHNALVDTHIVHTALTQKSSTQPFERYMLEEARTAQTPTCRNARAQGQVKKRSFEAQVDHAAL